MKDPNNFGNFVVFNPKNDRAGDLRKIILNN